MGTVRLLVPIYGYVVVSVVPEQVVVTNPSKFVLARKAIRLT